MVLRFAVCSRWEFGGLLDGFVPAARQRGPDGMPPITVDGQSVSIDGRRLWLVGATIEYTRIPRAQWGVRLRAARQAGFNCVLAPVVWSMHEPRPGAISFEGELDVGAFVREIGALGMHCIVRAGPFVGGGWDLGGLPAWLVKECGTRLRGNDPAYLGAVSRFTSALCDRISDLQASGSSKKRTGPIILVQSEHQWLCRDEANGDAALGELVRHLREGGINVPIVNSNNLFQAPEGTLDAWNADDQLFAHMRQIGGLHPEHPRLAVSLSAGDAKDEVSASRALLRAMGECVAAGAQFVVEPFFAGLAPGFMGVSQTGGSTFAPLGAGGERGAVYAFVKRLATFATSFERIMTGLDAGFEPVTASPAIGHGKAELTPSIVHRRGTQGSVVVVFATPGERTRVDLVLPDGSALPVEVGESGVAWMLLDAHLVDRAVLDHCTLSPFAMVGKAFVVFGTPGSRGHLSINGSGIDVLVPEKDATTPSVIEHEDAAIVVLNETMVDAAYATSEGVWVGIGGFDAEGVPLPHSSIKGAVKIGSDGVMSALQPGAAAKGSKSTAKLAFTAWSTARTDELVEGKSDRYAVMPGPASLEELGAAYGYAWLRLRMRSSSAKKVNAGFMQAADRLALFAGGEFVEVIGAGAGAEGWMPSLPLKSGDQAFTMLVDNTGRESGGPVLDGAKGLFGHVWELKALRAGSPKVENSDPMSPLSLRWPIMGVESNDRTDARRLTWRFAHRKSSPIAIVVAPVAEKDAPVGVVAALLVVNGKPTALLNLGVAGDRVLLSDESLARGNNIVQLAVLGDAESAFVSIKGRISFHECVARLTEKAEWAFAKWEPPAKGAWEAWTKGSKNGRGRPAWWKGGFSPAALDRPLYFDAAGLSKGQVYVNGNNVGRYWVATRTGKAVEGVSRLYLPEAWLKPGAANEVVLFDEHGFAPEKCSLTYA